MKKVLFVATVASHIRSFHIPYLKMLKENGYKTYVYANWNIEGEKKLDYVDEIIDSNIQRNPCSLKNISAIKDLKRIIDKEKFDLIHCHTPMGSVVARLASVKSRKNYDTKVIYTAHGFHFYKGASIKNWLLFYPVEWYLSKYTDTLITINNEDYELAQKKFSKRCKDIRYVPGVGIDKKKFSLIVKNSDKNNYKKSLGLKSDDIIISCVARLDNNKNQSFLIECMREIVTKNSKIHLLLAGRDELEGKYQNLVNKYNLNQNVHFLGNIDDIPLLLNVTSIVVSASQREGLGMNLLESIICNVPVLASHNRGHDSIIIDGNNGYFYCDKLDFINKVFLILEKSKNEFNNIDKTIDKFEINNTLKLMANVYGLQKDMLNVNNNNNLLFVHGAEKVKIDSSNNLYTDGAYSTEVWARYKKIASNVSVVFRKEAKVYTVSEASKKFQLLDKDILFYEMKNKEENIMSFISIKKEIFNRNLIKKLVSLNDYIIVRVPSDISYYAMKMARKYNKKLLVEVVGCPFDSMWNHSLIGKILAVPKYIKLKKNIKKADYVMYVSNQFLQKRYPNKNNTIGCSDVVLNDNVSYDLSKRLKKINNKKKNDPIILCTIGAVNLKYKGQQYIIKAIKQLTKMGFDIEYWLVGGGDNTLLNEIAQKYGIDNKIKFVGAIPHKSIFSLLDKIDIYVQPSTTEGMCRSIIEAMSRGCPCIVSNAGGNSELIDSKYVFKKKNINDFVDKFCKMLMDDELIAQSKRNYENSKFFEKKILDDERENFYKKFKNS